MPHTLALQVITDGLLTQDLYTVGRCARLAKSVLFMAEHEAKGSQAGGGVPHQWSGAITVEHVLPQGAEPDSNWFRPGSSGGSGWTAQASRQWLHKVGNLTLLSGPDNAAVGNRSFSDKKSILLERVHGRDAHEGMPVSTLVLTAQVAREESWTPAVVERRTAELAELLRARWRSLPPRPEPEPAPGPMRFRLVGTTPLSRQALGGPALGKILSQAGRQFLIGQGFAPQAQVLGYQGHVYRLVDLSRYAAVDARAVISRHQAVLRVSGDGVTVECAPWQPPDVQAGAPVMPMFLNGTQLEPGRQYEMDTDGTSLLCFGTGANSLKYTVTPYEGLAAVQEAAVAAAVAAAAPAVAESEEDEVVSDDEDDAAAVDLLDLALPLPHPDPVNDHRMAINLAMQLGAMGPIAQEMVETEAAVRAAGDNGDTPPRHPGAIDL